MLQTHFIPVQAFPVEDRFIKEWFGSVIQAFELTGRTELTHFRNYEINYEFEQPRDFVNRVIFKGRGKATLIAQKVNVEYQRVNGLPVVSVVRKIKRKPLLIYGKD